MSEYKFDVEKTTSELVAWIQKWISDNGNKLTKVIIGVSGGKDSSVTATLMVKALGKDRVIGVMMPNGEQKDISDSQTLVSHLGIKNFTVNIAKAYAGLQAAFQDAGILEDSLSGESSLSEVALQTNDSFSSVFKTNTPARLRMTSLYGLAAQIGNCRVVNTCNHSEDLVGYS
ncbi:MAG: NAD(+) synthase, partial [Treponema sp.]|nr:NAD(+) synthase [Treponema sp.]